MGHAPPPLLTGTFHHQSVHSISLPIHPPLSFFLSLKHAPRVNRSYQPFSVLPSTDLHPTPGAFMADYHVALAKAPLAFQYSSRLPNFTPTAPICLAESLPSHSLTLHPPCRCLHIGLLPGGGGRVGRQPPQPPSGVQHGGGPERRPAAGGVRHQPQRGQGLGFRASTWPARLSAPWGSSTLQGPSPPQAPSKCTST